MEYQILGYYIYIPHTGTLVWTFIFWKGKKVKKLLEMYCMLFASPKYLTNFQYDCIFLLSYCLVLLPCQIVALYHNLILI